MKDSATEGVLAGGLQIYPVNLTRLPQFEFDSNYALQSLLDLLIFIIHE